MAIAEMSMDRVRELVPNETLADRIRQKAVHATGDPEFQYLVRFEGDDRAGGGSAESTSVRAGAKAVFDE